MTVFRCVVLLSWLTVGAAWAGDGVLVAGEPPLTRALADAKIDFWADAFGLRPGDRERAELWQLEAGEWAQRDAAWKGRWIQLLAAWQAAPGGAKGEQLRAGARAAALASLTHSDPDALGARLLARAASQAPSSRIATLQGGSGAIERDLLRRRQAMFDEHMRMMSDVQARHHETMMTIIRNIGPSGRYEYNPATQRYERWVPYR